MTDTKVRMAKDGGFPINEELAGLVPMAMEAEQIALTADIAKNEQREPIVLWRGKVVDGRCRQLALTTLGKHIMYRELDSNLTEEEARIYVKSVNTRRNLTVTQKIMSACRASLLPNADKVANVAKSWGISKATLENARYIARHRPEMVEPLFNGKTVKIVNAEGKEVESNKITAIYASIRREMEKVNEDTQHGWKEDSYIKTQKGKEWYYNQVRELTDLSTRMMIAELANYKFKEEKVDEE